MGKGSEGGKRLPQSLASLPPRRARGKRVVEESREGRTVAVAGAKDRCCSGLPLGRRAGAPVMLS